MSPSIHMPAECIGRELSRIGIIIQLIKNSRISFSLHFPNLMKDAESFGLPIFQILFLSFFFFCMFYKFLCVPHSRPSTQSWGSVLPSIVETRDQNSRGCPFSFRIGIWDLFLCIGDRNPIHPQPLGSCGPLQE